MELETVNCLLCNSHDGKILSVQGETGEFAVRKCRKCGFVYLSPRPTIDSISEIYSESYYKDGKTGYQDYEKNFYKYEQIYKQLFNIREKLITRFKAPGKLLEIGCAYGFQLAYLRTRGWDVTGIDISPISSSYARDHLKLNVATGPLKAQNFPDDYFDVVLLIDVIEHLHQPKEELFEIKRILKPEGILLVQVPYELFHWEEIMEAILKGMKPGSIAPDALPAHLYFFSPGSLRSLLETCGFNVLHRASGNYGAVRSKISPPDTSTGNFTWRLCKKTYYRYGLQKLLYYIARQLKQGNGIIIITQPKNK